MPSSPRPDTAAAARPPPRLLHRHHPHPPPSFPSSSCSSSSAITTTTTSNTPIAAAEEVLSDYKNIKAALLNLHKQHLLQKRQAKAEVESWRSRAEEAETQLEEMQDLYHHQEQQQQQQAQHKEEEEGQQQHEYETLCSQVIELAEENRTLQMHMLELEEENQEHRAQREATHIEVFRLQEKISEMELSLQAQQRLNVEKNVAMATLQRELKESEAREEELSAKNAALIREKQTALEAEVLAAQKRQEAAAEVETRRKLLQDRRRITEALMTEIDMVEQQVG